MADTLRTLRRILIGLAILGTLVAGHLTVIHFIETQALGCAPGGGCDTIRQSPYSEVAGIPVALIGLLGYTAIVGVLILEETSNVLGESGPIILFGLSLIGILYSIYLTYLELFVIYAICPYCVASAVIMLAIFGVGLYRMAYSLRS